LQVTQRITADETDSSLLPTVLPNLASNSTMMTFVYTKEAASAFTEDLTRHRVPATTRPGQIVDEHDVIDKQIPDQGALLQMIDQGAELSRSISVAAKDISSPTIKALCAMFSNLIDGLSLLNNFISTYGGYGALKIATSIVLDFNRLVVEIKKAIRKTTSPGWAAGFRKESDIVRLKNVTND
jgi:hypothetical protein